MLIERQRDIVAETMSLIETAAANGRDWALTVKCDKALQLDVQVSWAGGVRNIASEALVAGTHDVDLPVRIPGRKLEVLATSVVVGGQVAAALSWTPDLVCEEEDQC